MTTHSPRAATSQRSRNTARPPKTEGWLMNGVGSPGPGDIHPVQTVDRVEAFQPAVLLIRWGTTLVSLALAAPDLTNRDVVMASYALTIFLYTGFRTVRPIRYVDNLLSLAQVLGEVVLLVWIVAATGYWNSPFIFSLLTAVIVAGFARGFGFGIRVAAAGSMAISLPFLLQSDPGTDEYRLAAQWSASLLLVGLMAGWARQMSGEADRQQTLALDRLSRLSDANALLFNLHRIAQTLPASLEIGEVLDTTVGRLRGLFSVDAVAVLILDDTDANWEVARREGVRLPLRMNRDELPPPLEKALRGQEALRVADLQGPDGPGLSGRAGSGMYAPLLARGILIGLLAVEAREPDSYSGKDLDLFQGLMEPIALALDNARWFDRLRTVGADEERTRIARDLHDSIGQSLAYLAFELDRLIDRHEQGHDVADELNQLRRDVRGVIGEVRDTLYDLRTDVSEEEGLSDVLEDFAVRVRDRSNLDIELHLERALRLPILQERELWRIAQEALTNVERHARAKHVSVVWRCDGVEALLEIADDGEGLPAGKAGRLDSYGILGMRERAASIGATLELVSSPGVGTTVRCHLAASEA